jgi:hypothetical protein
MYMYFDHMSTRLDAVDAFGEWAACGADVIPDQVEYHRRLRRFHVPHRNAARHLPHHT